MKELVFRSEKNTPVTTSLLVAEKFEKNHRDVLEAIDELVKGVAEKSADLFHETTYVHHQNKQKYGFSICPLCGEEFKFSEYLNTAILNPNTRLIANLITH